MIIYWDRHVFIRTIIIILFCITCISWSAVCASTHNGCVLAEDFYNLPMSTNVDNQYIDNKLLINIPISNNSWLKIYIEEICLVIFL